MKITKILSALLLGASAATAAAQSDPTLMRVDGKDIKLSEFEYLYNKNNAQQVEPQTLDSYLRLFTDYRLKVADALRAGIDTTAAFQAEYTKYRDDLARPYLRDQQVADQLEREAYDHYSRNLLVSHIMVPVTFNDGRSGKVVADSLLAAIRAGETTFEDAARANSMDTPSATRGGLMGTVTAGRFPYPFEKAAYETATGQLSEPVNSGFGWHIIRVESSQPNQGEVQASHILLGTRGLSDANKAAASARIDSIYACAKAGEDFADLARRFSQDPGSAMRGGDLGWFKQGMMVQPFDSIAFAMAVDEVSEPFATDFGYHIIHKTGARPIATFEDARKEIDEQIQSDARAQLPVQTTLRALAARTGSMVHQSTLEALEKMILDPAQGETLSQASAEAINGSSMPAFVVDGKDTTVAAALADSPLVEGMNKQLALDRVKKAINSQFDHAMFLLAAEELEKNNTEYRNLLNEYRDGILLFDISNSNVWDRATKDTEGLKRYFEKNRKKYAWSAPKFKSFVIFAPNDSVLALAQEFTDSIGSNPIASEELSAQMRKRFGRDIKVERVLAAKGDNAITDFLAFGADKPAAANKRWSSYYAFQGRVIAAPEEAADARGSVVADYQAELEKQWLKQLRKKYKVTVNKAVLEQLKK